MSLDLIFSFILAIPPRSSSLSTFKPYPYLITISKSSEKGKEGIWVARGNLDGKPKEDESKEKEDDSIEVEYKMWESCKIEKKEFSPEREQEQESFEDEVDLKVWGGEEGLDQINGVTSTESIDDGTISPSKQQQQPSLRRISLFQMGYINISLFFVVCIFKAKD
ncbi:hypothetical protein L3X38_015512 [Prunus dulcis]|uniref:Transmembrane protein n=1 Tax=Prunus dulcis TaxID=3755 RepID=A0AAD4W3J3_PRUDU|nr:hypothetical protein L3X38_015512 [Prunus dulcis]